MKISTWNLKRPIVLDQPRVELLRQTIEGVGADIWVFTETNSEVGPQGEFHKVCSEQIGYLHKRKECRTAIWSKFPIVNKIETYDPKTAVCVEIESPLGPMLVLGTVIPFEGAGLSWRYWFNNDRREASERWEIHMEAIDVHRLEIMRIRKQYPEHHFCFAGDFNQRFDPIKTGARSKRSEARACLTEMFDQCELKLLTDVEFPNLKTERNPWPLDHICLSRELAQRVSNVDAWAPRSTADGKMESDHKGVLLDISKLKLKALRD